MNKGWLLQEIGRAIGSSIRDTFDRQYRPDEGFCPAWLAYCLGYVAWAVLLTAIITAPVR